MSTDKEFLKRLKEQINAGAFDFPKKQDELGIENQLFVAILLGPIETIEYLLKVKKADPNATNRHGTTLLQLALAFNREDVAHLLYQYGAVPSFPENKKHRSEVPPSTSPNKKFKR